MPLNASAASLITVMIKIAHGTHLNKRLKSISTLSLPRSSAAG